MDHSAFLHHLRQASFYQGQIIHVEHLPSREAAYAELDKPLPTPLHSALHRAGMLPLYSHQATAVQMARSGKNVMVVTPAASGKTLCYNLPVLEAILTEKRSRALYLFPTKALAQDQLRSLRELTSWASPQVECATFDGDTPYSQRAEIKRQVQIVLTNPDMLHMGILPNHSAWSRFFRNLRYVIVDEAHAYRGIFGSHVSNVLRRLRRLCASYGASPQFICCSATIANPGEHISRLVGLPFEIVDQDGSPHGLKEFIFWNPPLLGEGSTTRRSANSEASYLFAELARQDIRSLAFARTRRLTEIIYNYAKDRLAGSPQAERISPYRAGYLAEERRQIERAFLEGQLVGVIATTALELGVDIGDLEATVLTGYPGSIASTWQQAGRSGRKTNPSLSFLIGLNSPLDQYLMHHPSFFFSKSCENALTNPDNPHILKPHLLCASWELPLTDGDGRFFTANFAGLREELENKGLLKRREQRWHIMPSVAYPAEKVNLRSTSAGHYTIFDLSRESCPLETVESSVAFFMIHPGAVYLHRGESYLVTGLDLAARAAYAVPTNLPYYTQTKDITDLKIRTVTQQKDTRACRVYLGNVEVTTTVLGFSKKMQFTEEVLGEEPLDLPPQTTETVALWFDIPAGAIDQINEAQLNFAGGLHATEHATIAMLPLFALCDRNDIGGLSTPLHPDTGKPEIFIYDAHPGGAGISEKGFELIHDLWQVTLEAIESCPCEEGCPACIQSPKCGNNNKPLDKKAARLILGALAKGKP